MANRDREDVIDTIIAEAYGEGRKGMVAVASVINNRAQTRGQTIGQVVRSKGQFDGYARPGSAARKAQQNQKLRAEVGRLLDGVQNGTIADPTGGADHFYSGSKPGWADKLQKTAAIGGHTFHQSAQAAAKLGKGIVEGVGKVADVATAPARQVAAGVGNMASALRTAAFSPISVPRPSVPVGDPFSRYNRANLTPGISNALDVLAYAPQAANVGINSGYRSPTRNARAGGASKSQHLHGNAVDLDISRLSPADRTALLDLAIEKGNVKGVGVYPSGNSLHIDTRGNPMAWGPSPRGKYSGLSQAELNQLPEWARDSIKGMYQAGPYAVTPRTTAPTPTPRPSPTETMMAAPLGKVERAPLADAAPRPPDAARFAYDTQPNPERFGPRAPATTAKVDRLPSTNIPEPNAARFAYDVNPAPSPERFGYGIVSPAAAAPVTPATPQEPITTPKTSRLPASPVDPVKQASIYSQYAASRMAAPATPPGVSNMLTSSAPVGPAQTLGPQPPQPTFVPSIPNIPVQAQPMPVQQRIDQAFNTASFPAAPPTPQYTAADVYAGRASVGQATGGNTVSRDQFGNTSVTNKYGVTTTTGPSGNQMASSGPGIGGPLGGNIGSIFEARPDLNGRSQFGNAARGVGGRMAGSAIGSLGGPVGSIIGALIGGELAKPGGGRIGDFFNGVKTFDVLGQPMKFARPVNGGPFPTAPRGPAGALGGRESNLTDRQMRDISPRAADAISKGVGGLY